VLLAGEKVGRCGFTLHWTRCSLAGSNTFGFMRRCLTSDSVNLQDGQEVSDCSFYRGDSWALRFYPELDEKQPSEQQPHARLGPEKFDELDGGGDR
jgi:hypothetical protein